MLFYMEKRSYHDYKTLQTSEQEDIVSTKYEEMAGKVLRYSPDSISLVSDSLETVWSETCAMQNPVADVNEDKAVVADVDGNMIAIFDREGLTGTVTTSYTIVKATISSSGLVAAILDGETKPGLILRFRRKPDRRKPDKAGRSRIPYGRGNF